MENRFDRLSDEELVILAQGEDQEALEFLIRKYIDLVRSKKCTYFIMGAEDDDVVQEGTIGLLKAIRNYDPEREASFSTFAEVCINRQILSAIKAANRKKHSPLNTSLSLNRPGDESGTALEEFIPSGKLTDPETLMILKDVMDYISRNEGKLFSELEVTVWHEYAQGKSYGEMAAALGRTPKAIYNAMERTKKKIISYLSD